ncbi:MAG: ATP-dependent DNA helicase RecG [Thermomicrobiales bacterium]|nr:ATP-dependent DNA helicase RecG [Thermomicrobiales bacterium]
MPSDRSLSSSTDRVNVAIDALRHVWVGGDDYVRELIRATDALTAARQGVPYQIVHELDTSIAALRALPRDLTARRAAVQTIAERLKAINAELLSATQPPVEKGKLTSALVPQKRKPLRLSVSPDDLLTALPGIGAKKLKPFNEGLHLYTVQDLLQFMPRRHIDYSKSTNLSDPLQMRGDIVVQGTISNIQVIRAGTPRVQARLTNETGSIRITWFSTYIQNQLHEGDRIVVAGTLAPGYGGLQLTNPEWEPLSANGVFQMDALVPVYPLTKGISQKMMRLHTRTAIEATRDRLVDWLGDARPFIDDDVWDFLPGVETMYEHIHYPPHIDDYVLARKRLTFENLLLLQLGMVQMRTKAKAEEGRALRVDPDELNAFITTLPFPLTGAQRRVVAEMLGDIGTDSPMTRLVQGDVGSGKTVVATIGAWAAWRNGYQSAIMAPTELLAEQHAVTFERIFSALPEEARPKVALITGSTRAKERREIVAGLEAGEIDIAIGTHALFSDDIAFTALGFVVIDEQHRFGVNQRTALTRKAHGYQPHLLSMTATPIPRTLNLVLHGDLDVSVIDERPPGRVPISTFCYVGPARSKAYQLVRHEVQKGHQVFVICPLVNESDTIVAKAAVEEAERLQNEVFPGLKVDVLHGKMRSKAKDEIMERFRNHEFDILVSTSVIEVGIDIPNATVMMIEGADRFGLAQLHQFRGRVGRGENKSYCLLLSDDVSAENNARLQTMVATDDGFVLAEKDLELRGPGDVIGTRQSGLPDLGVLEMGFDSRILDRARATAERLIAADPEISEVRFPRLKPRLRAYWQHRQTTIAPAS